MKIWVGNAFVSVHAWTEYTRTYYVDCFVISTNADEMQQTRESNQYSTRISDEILAVAEVQVYNQVS